MPIRAIDRRRGQILATPRGVRQPLPVPVGGWNARDALTAMSEADAIILDNWFPETGYVRVRNGHASHATGMSGDVESLMVWSGAGGSKMFAAASGSVYEVTGAAAVGSAEFSSQISSRWNHTMFGNSAGNFLYIVNGVDSPRYYDGTSWTTPTITAYGLNPAHLATVTNYKFRLFFTQKAKLGFWYFPSETLSGDITYYDVSALCSRGGYLVHIGTWTRDAGDGVDDVLCCITSEGEVVLFQGTNPASATSWSFIGTFQIGPPLGRRCLVKYGSDLVVMSKDGFYPLSRFLTDSRISQATALSDKIRGAVTDAIKNYSTIDNWEPVFYPKGNMLLFNVPGSQQFVMNTTTGSWCRFTGQNAKSWAVLNDRLYFGGTGGEVFLADYGSTDDGGSITTDCQMAFGHGGNRGLLKQYTLAELIFKTNTTVTPQIGASVDYVNKTPVTVSSFSGPTVSSLWDVADWDVALWGDTIGIVKVNYSLHDLGFSMGLRFKTTTSDGILQWLAAAAVFQPSRGLL